MNLFLKTGKSVIIALLAVLLVSCNASKSLTKKGDKLADAGIHKEAVEFYIKALNRNRANVDAQVGLRKSGGEVMTDLQSKFFKEYNADNFRSSVYTFMEMEKFKERLDAYNAELTIANHTKEDFKIAKKNYLEAQFEKANQYMAEEQFGQAEAIFVEIQEIEPSYKGGDLEKLKEIAQLEPPYRRGNEYLDQNKNRSAYMEFKRVTDQNPNYKDAKFKQEEALELAQFPVAILKFKNFSGETGASEKVEANMINDLLNNKGPFVKVLDRTNMDDVLNEQYLAMNGWVEGKGAVKTGQLLGAKAILSGKLLSVKKETRAPQVKREKAYRKRAEKFYNSETKRIETKYVYDKIYYNNHQGYTRTTVSIQYILVSAETGEVLSSGIEERVIEDKINYNSYQEDYRDLYPGTWKVRFQDSPGDRRITNRNQVRDFQNTFTANKVMRSANDLAEDAYKALGADIARKVYDFNPER